MDDPNYLSWSEFSKVEMYVGTILSANNFEEAKNPAYKLEIDFGPHGIKKSSAQITDLYSLDDLIGKQIIGVLNFPPKQIANMMSECLVLGAMSNSIGVSLLKPDIKVENGTKVG